MELKGDFNRSSLSRDGTKRGPPTGPPSGPHSREDRKRLMVFTVTSSNSKIKIARPSECLAEGD